MFGTIIEYLNPDETEDANYINKWLAYIDRYDSSYHTEEYLKRYINKIESKGYKVCIKEDLILWPEIDKESGILVYSNVKTGYVISVKKKEG